MREVKGEGLPEPIGAYSIATVSNGFVFLSGQIPIKDGEIFKGEFREQVRIVLENAKKILEAAGTSLDRVVKVTIFIRNMDRFPELNEVYSEFFKPPYPARAVIEVSRLPKDVDVEIEMVAEVG